MSPQEAAERVVGWPVRLWRWSGQTKTSLRTAAAIFAAGCFAFLTLRANDNEAAQRDAAFALYQAELSQYQNAHDEWERCLIAVANRESARNSDFAAVTSLENVIAIFNAYSPLPLDLQEKIDEEFEERRAQIDDERPSLDPATCGSEPQPPPLRR